ncbi:MAG: BamA/TamA family outer membrane protein [Caldithrix sp.]|nr:BamA/TamA family outer membrane protein [Caldithrix sp.]
MILNKKIVRYMAACIFIVLFHTPLLHSSQIFKKTVKLQSGTVKITSDTIGQTPKIGLVLSGGGSRGIAHIGVLQVLEQYDIPFHLIVGSSIGSVIGGLYAAGYSPQEIEEITKTINWDKIYRDEANRRDMFFRQKGITDRYLLSIRFDKLQPFIPNAFSPGQKVLSKLSELVLKAKYHALNDFDDLRIPFRAISTDLISGQLIVIDDGDLAEGLNASLAVPLLFSPVEKDSMLLVDGGLRTNLPVDVAIQEGMDLVIAVDITAHLRERNEIKAPWEIVDQATTILSDLSDQMQREKADILIEPLLQNFNNTDFSQIDRIIQHGRDAALIQIPRIKQLIDQASAPQNTIFDIDSVGIESDRERITFNTLFSIINVKNKHLNATKILNNLDRILETGQFASAEAQLTASNPGYNLTYNMKVFQSVHQIEFNGNSLLSDEILQRTINTSINQPLNVQILKNDLNTIVEMYRRKGKSLMTIEEVQWDNQNGRLSLSIDEGKIDDIRLIGNEKSMDYVILREFNGLKNKIYDQNAVQNAIENVYATQLFEKVTAHVQHIHSKNILRIKVKEKSSVVLHLGGKVDSDRKAQVYIEFGDENLFGTGIKSTFLNRIGTRDGHFALKVWDDRIFTTYFTVAMESYYKWQQNLANGYDFSKGRYREERVGIRLQAGQQLRRIGQLVGELRIENIDEDPLTDNLTIEDEFRLRAFAIRALTDKRDRIDFPTEGIFNHWAWEYGSKLLLDSEESYIKAFINLESYYTINDYNTWHLRFFAGIGDRTLPFSENFRMGGLEDFYGLHTNEYFGRQLVIGSAEYRLNLPPITGNESFLFGKTHLSFRYDLGGIWENPALVFSTDDFFTGMGAALGLETLLGPLKVAYGQTSRGKRLGYLSLGFNF